MEEQEVEDGDAWSGQEVGSIIDPDISLSYIDEKIQDVLGHFQKDFEGGVSVENLGSKFGGYGSFLPTYLRSPERVPNHNNNSNATPDPSSQGSHHRPALVASEPVSRKTDSAAIAPQVDGVKGDEVFTVLPFFNTQGTDIVNKLSNSNCQRIPKIRIKVGPRSALPRCNAAIYNDMGLDCSPSSSPVDSATASGSSQGTGGSNDQSPISVLKIMTCFPIPGGYVLSPLSEHLLQLMENEKPYPIDLSFDTKSIEINGCHATKAEASSASTGKELLANKSKSHEPIIRSFEFKSLNSNADTDGEPGVQRRSKSRDAGDKADRQQLEVEMKTSGIAEEPNKSLGKDKKRSCVLSAQDPWEGMPSLATGIFDTIDHVNLKGKLKPEGYPKGKEVNESKLNNQGSIQFDSDKGRCEQTCDAFKPVTSLSKGTQDSMPAKDIKRKEPCKSAKHEGEGGRMLQPQHNIPGKRRKSKLIDDPQYADSLKENLTVSFSLPLKEIKKKAHPSRSHFKSAKQNALSPLESSRALSSAVLSLQEAKGEVSEYRSCLPRDIIIDKRIDSKMCTKKDASFVHNAKDGDVERPPRSKSVRKNLSISPSNANGTAPDADAALSSDSSDPDHWVLCDRCAKWRMLPYWMDPDQLPHRWLCKMLNWLPGMNNCKISQNETTSALLALYRASVPENQGTMNNCSREIVPGAVSTSIQNVNDDSTKKNQHVSVKSRSLHQNQVQSNKSDKPSFQPVNEPTQLSEEKVEQEQNRRHKIVEQCSAKGDLFHHQSYHSMSLRVPGKVTHKTSKRLKMEEPCGGKEYSKSYHNLAKTVPFGDDGSSSKSSEVTMRSVLGYKGHSSFTYFKDNSEVQSGSQSKPRAILMTSSIGVQKANFKMSHEEKYKKGDSSMNKRKMEQQECQVPPQAEMDVRAIMKGRANVEEANGIKTRKPKRSKMSKIDERDTLRTLMEDKIQENNQAVKVLLSTKNICTYYGLKKKKELLEDEQRENDQRSLESQTNMDYPESKNDLTYVLTSKIDTSCSSKVSGSLKNRSNFQDAQGSPVESVSSSPSRVLNGNKFDTEKETSKQDGPLSSNLTVSRGSRRCSGSKGGQADQRAIIISSKSFSDLGTFPNMGLEVMDLTSGAPHYLNREAPSLTDGNAKGGPHFLKDSNLIDDTQDKDCRKEYPDKQNHCYNSNCSIQEKSDKVCSSLETKEKYRSGMSDACEQEKHSSSMSDVSKHKTSAVNKCKVKASDSIIQKRDASLIKNEDSFMNDADIDSVNQSICPENLRKKRHKVVCRDKEKKVSSGKFLSGHRSNDKHFGGEDNVDVGKLQDKQHNGDPSSKVNEAVTISTVNILSLHDAQPGMMCCEDGRSLNSLDLNQAENLKLTKRGRSQSPSQPMDKVFVPQEPKIVISNMEASRSASPVDISNDASKIQKEPKVDSQHGAHQNTSVRTDTVKHDSTSPIRRDGNHFTASVVLKEAINLKHTANRLKRVGLEHESTDLYFQASLKFLHVASLLESSSESSKVAELARSMTMYTETAKLCGFCAHEYEKRKAMAAAALAYKCMEVAYMRVIFSRYPCASKDQHELQTALHTIISSESPSSSTSDVENVNHSSAEKADPLGSLNSLQMAGNHIITAHHHPTVGRLLNFVQDVSCAMDASRKSHTAFRAANDGPERCGPEAIHSVRKVLDFSFHDVDGLLHAVRLSLDSIGS